MPDDLGYMRELPMLPADNAPQVLMSPDVVSAIRLSMSLGQSPNQAIGLRPSLLELITPRRLPTVVEAAPEPDESLFAEAAKSFASALVPESLGMKPSLGVEAFRQEHPTLGMATEIAGLLPGYVAGMGLANTALRAVPRVGPAFAKAVTGLGMGAAESAVAPAVQSSIARGALRTALEVVPFEAVRIGTALTTEGASHARDIAAQSLINIGASAAIGAGIRAFAESRPARMLALRGEEAAAKVIADYNVAEATQEKLGRLRVFSNTPAFQTKLAEGDKSNIIGLINRFEKDIETEWAAGPNIKKMVSVESDHLALGKVFTRVRGSAETHGPYSTYKIDELKSGKVRGLSQETQKEMLLRLKDTLLPGWHQYAKHPTLVRPRNAEGASKVSALMKKNLKSVDSVRGWYMGKEADSNGLYIMARKIRGGAAPAEGDLWFSVKTNSPRQLLPHYESQLRDLERVAFGMRESPKVMGAELHGRVKDPLTGSWLPGTGIGIAKDSKPLFEAALAPEEMFLSLDLPGQRELKILSLLPKALLDDIVVGAREMGTSLKRFIAPTTARASTISEGRITQVSRGVAALAHKRVVETWAGKLPKGATAGTKVGGLFKQLKEARQGGLRPLVREMAKRNSDDLPTLAQFTSAIDNDMTLAEVAENGFDASVIRLLQKLRALRFDKDRELRLATDLYGFTGELIFKDSYYHVAKAFRGNLRLPIHQLADDGTLGPILDYASGSSRNTVMREAQAIKEAMAEKGFKIAWPTRGTHGGQGRVDVPLISPYTAELDGRLMSKIQRNTPAYRAMRDTRLQFYKRPQTPGRLLGSSLPERVSFGLRPLNESEISERIFSSLLEHERFVGEMMLRGKYLKPELSRLAGMTPEVVPGGGFWKAALDTSDGEFPLAASNISNTIIKLFGADPPGSFSRMVDEMSTNLIGIPASSITRSVNQAMFHLMLAAGDLGFPALNGLSVIQAALPEIAYVQRAPTRELAKYYTVHMVRNRAGVTGLHALDPMKIGYAALKDIRNPTPELRRAVQWAVENDAASPRFVEEWAGKLTGSIKPSAVRSGEVSFLEWTSNVNKYLPVKSEEFARLWSFLIGRRLGTDFMKLEGDDVYRFAKAFTEKTMFNYGAADRAAMITGPIGSFWGLFKNWSMHYMWNMWGYGKHAFQTGDMTPLLWAMGTTGAIGGATAVPGYFAIDKFAKWVGDKSAMNLVYEALEGDEPGTNPLLDTFFYGLPSFLGLSLTARASVPGADPIRDVNTFFSIATLDRVAALAKLPMEFIDLYSATGEMPGQSRAVFDHFMRATMPRTVYRFQQAAAEEGIRSLGTGNLMIKDPGYLQRIAFVLGITPLEVQKHFDLSAELWRQQESAKKKVMLRGEEYAEAMENKDLAGQSALIRRAFLAGENPQAIISSGITNYNNRNRELNERQFDNYLQRKQVRAVLGREY